MSGNCLDEGQFRGRGAVAEAIAVGGGASAAIVRLCVEGASTCGGFVVWSRWAGLPH